jgi:hypothetical protein
MTDTKKEMETKILFFFRDYLGKQAESSAGNNTNVTSNGLGQRPVESRA